MPARKNRPSKFGGPPGIKRAPPSDEDRALIAKFVTWERMQPGHDHYVGWPDMHIAKRLAKRGLIREGRLATGCFAVTDAFRERFMLEGRT